MEIGSTEDIQPSRPIFLLRSHAVHEIAKLSNLTNGAAKIPRGKLHDLGLVVSHDIVRPLPMFGY